MVDKSQERALVLLEEAKEKGDLDPAIEKGLVELIGREKIKEVLETTEKRELSPEQADSLVSTLKTRFDLPENKKLRKVIDFVDVEKSLRASPEKLYALQKLEETGGEPQVIGIDSDEYVFEDRCKESPFGRRDLDADQSAAQADGFGTDMQSPEAYKAMQETGDYDLHSGSWLKTDPEYLKRTGYAMRGRCFEGDVDVVIYNAGDPGPSDGWRASLRVPKAKEANKTENMTPNMTVYCQEYNILSDDIKERCLWEEITKRLLANGSKKLKLAKNMQGEGQLFGIDAEGRALFKDRGVEPVMYGYGEGKLLQVYDRNPEQMKRVRTWVNYQEIRDQILADGYELFAFDLDDDCNRNYGFGDEMNQATDHTGEPFVASDNREDCRVSWLESGTISRFANYAYFDPAIGRVRVRSDDSTMAGSHYGAIRLLRV